MRVHSAILAATLLVLLFPFHAVAQSELILSDFALPAPGEPRSVPPDIDLQIDEGSLDIRSASAASAAMLKEYTSNVRVTRNARDIAVYREAAPAVVLVVTDGGIGSGSLLEDKTILTNWHVVKGYKQVSVIFKPDDHFKTPTKEDLVAASVIKIDATRDLALLRPKSLPSRQIMPIKIAAEDNMEIGADVHAIGHPTGEIWTYTKGVISQIRRGYEWSYSEQDVKHRATIIQTQTPINPGNSGGPLLEDSGQLIGVNAFGTASAQGLNFAIAAQDVRAFLATPIAQSELQDQCKFRVIFEGRSKDNDAYIKNISMKCDDRADIVIVIPDDKKKPVMALVDVSRRDKVEGVVFDERRIGKWNTSFWDPKLDETFPLRGLHPDGDLMPTTMEQRCRPPSKPLKNLKCS